MSSLTKVALVQMKMDADPKKNLSKAIEKIKLAIKEKRVTKKEIDARVKKILAAKYKYGLSNFQPIDTTNIVADLNKSVAAFMISLSAMVAGMVICLVLVSKFAFLNLIATQVANFFSCRSS